MAILYRSADKLRICFQLIDSRMTRDAWAELCQTLEAVADRTWHIVITVGDAESKKIIHLRQDGCRYAEEWVRLCSELRQDPESCEEMDVALHLTYDNAPDTLDEARKDIQNFFRRIKYIRRKEGLPELKYVYKTEMSRTGRIHHHVIMSGGISRDLVEEKWGRGYANSKRLRFTETGVKGLTVYMLKGDETYRRWTSSKNLIDPAPMSRDYKITRKDVQELMELDSVVSAAESIYAGWEFVEGDSQRNNVNAGVYVKLLLRRKEAAKKPG